MKKTILMLFSLLILTTIFSCSKETVETSLEGNSYIVDFGEVNKSLSWRTPQNGSISANTFAVLSQGFKSLFFGKGNTLSIVSDMSDIGGNGVTTITGTYEELNGGKTLKMNLSTKKTAYFNVVEKSKNTLVLSIDWNDTSFIPENYTLIYHLKKI